MATFVLQDNFDPVRFLRCADDLGLGHDFGKIGFEFEAKAPKEGATAKAPAKKRAGASAATKSAAKPKRASKTKSSPST